MEQIGFLILMNGMTREDYVEMMKILCLPSNVGEDYDKAVASTGVSPEFLEFWNEMYLEVKSTSPIHYKGLVAGFWQNKGGSVEDMSKCTGLPKESLLELKKKYSIDENPKKKKRSE